MHATTYALDLAKNVFRCFWIDSDGARHNRNITRAGMREFFAKRAPGRVAMEACATSHYWARELKAFGYEVIVIDAKAVKAYREGAHKSDARDALAIWRAAQDSTTRKVSVKTAAQQAVLALHSVREQLVKMRTMQINQLRSILAEFGIVFPTGRIKLMKEFALQAESISLTLGTDLCETLREQFARIAELDTPIELLEQRICAQARTDARCKRLDEVAGIGPLIASATVATIGDGKAFANGRQLAAFIGLVPKQSGTGGKIHLGKITKSGNEYLRRLFIHGARAVVCGKNHSPWLTEVLKRRPKNVAVVAQANKLVRIAWALLAHERDYDRHYVSRRPKRPVRAPLAV